MKALLALLNVLRKGEQVTNPAAWKNRQISANALAVFVAALAGLARALDIPWEVTDADALAIGGGVLALVNVVLTAATSRRVGLPASGPAAGGKSAG